jgi:hypothetical protein
VFRCGSLFSLAAKLGGKAEQAPNFSRLAAHAVQGSSWQGLLWLVGCNRWHCRETLLHLSRIRRGRVEKGGVQHRMLVLVRGGVYSGCIITEIPKRPLAERQSPTKRASRQASRSHPMLGSPRQKMRGRQPASAGLPDLGVCNCCPRRRGDVEMRSSSSKARNLRWGPRPENILICSSAPALLHIHTYCTHIQYIQSAQLHTVSTYSQYMLSLQTVTAYSQYRQLVHVVRTDN